MGRIAVDTGALTGAAGQGMNVADQVSQLRGVLAAAGAGAAAAGAPALAASMAGCAEAWTGGLAQLTDSVAGMGRNLGAASSAYATTDSEAFPGD